MNNYLRAVIVSVCSFIIAAPVAAGGPLATKNGKPVRYKSNIISYSLDRGPFGIFTNQQARDLANQSFKVWEDVATSSVAFQHTDADTLPVDVDGSNFLQFTTLTDVKIDSINPIVFDSDGSITDALFGSGSASSIIGFAWSEDIDNDGYFDEGEAFMNGKFADGTKTSFTLDEWKSTFVHEFGHMLGLDHTQINGQFVNDAAKTIYIPTMYPTSTANDVPLGDLNPDDIAAISALYPEPAFATTTGVVSGSVVRENSAVVQGANVIAVSTWADSLMNQISTITDYYELGKGDFNIIGLSPGPYYVRIEPVDPQFTEGSSVGPFSYDANGLSFINPVVPEYYNGSNESGNPTVDDPNAKSIVTVTPGDTTKGVNIIANEKTNAVLLTENFSFSGLLSANGWSVHSGTTNSIATTAGLTYAAYSGSGIGNAAFITNLGDEDVNKGMDTQGGSGITIYASLLVNVTDSSDSRSGDYFFHLGNRTNATTFTLFASRLFARIVSGKVNFGVSNTSTATYGTTNFEKNKVYLVMTKYTINTNGNDEIKLWVFPSGVPVSEDAAGSALVTNTGTSGQDIINAVGLRQGSASNSPAVVVDGIIVGTGWPSGQTAIVENQNGVLVKDFRLDQNFPNPFNPSTVIRFTTIRSGYTTLNVYDVVGRNVQTLVSEYLQPGTFERRFNASTLPSGIYFYQLRNESNTITKKMIVMK